MCEVPSDFKPVFRPLKTLLIRPGERTDRLARIIAGDSKAAYRDIAGSTVLTVLLLDEFGDATAIVMSIAGRAEIGVLTYCPRSLYGDGPVVRRGDNSRTIALAERQWIAGFCRDMLEGGQA